MKQNQKFKTFKNNSQNGKFFQIDLYYFVLTALDASVAVTKYDA